MRKVEVLLNEHWRFDKKTVMAEKLVLFQRIVNRAMSLLLVSVTCHAIMDIFIVDLAIVARIVDPAMNTSIGRMSASKMNLIFTTRIKHLCV
jgi:hypothetical protein